jgi:hypothetical protein
MLLRSEWFFTSGLVRSVYQGDVRSPFPSSESLRKSFGAAGFSLVVGWPQEVLRFACRFWAPYRRLTRASPGHQYFIASHRTRLS